MVTPPVAVYAVLPNTNPEQRELLRTFTEAGQQYFTAQSGKTVLEGGTVGLVTETFRGAPAGNGNGGGGLTPEEKEKVLTTDGERFVSPAPSIISGITEVHMQHAVWLQVPSDAQGVNVTPANTENARQMQLVFTPAAIIEDSAAWLQGATWLYGAPVLGAGITYVITLTQALGEIRANATVWKEAL